MIASRSIIGGYKDLENIWAFVGGMSMNAEMRDPFQRDHRRCS